MALEIFVNTGPYGAESLKRYFSYSFHLISPKLVRTLGTMGEYKLLLFLALDQVLKMCHFEILAWEPIEKS